MEGESGQTSRVARTSREHASPGSTDPPATRRDGGGRKRGERERKGGGRGFPPGVLRWGLLSFLLGSAVGFAALLLLTRELGPSLRGFRRFDPVWALPSLFFASLDWFGGGFRLWILLRPLDIRVSYWSCVRISGATAGLAYLTPSGVGGGTAHIYGLVRDGVSVGRAAASSFASLLVNLLFLSWAGLTAWFLGASDAMRGLRLPLAGVSASALFEWTVSVFVGVVALLLLFALDPRPARGWIIRLFGSGRRVRTVLRWIHELHASLLLYARRGKWALVLATLSGTLHFGGRFLLGWSVLRGFGVDPGFWNVVLLHVLLQFLLIFMPTPGGTGVGEVLAPALMRPFLPNDLLVAYTAVWRFFLSYLTVALGGGILVRWLNVDRKRLMEDGSD